MEDAGPKTCRVTGRPGDNTGVTKAGRMESLRAKASGKAGTFAEKLARYREEHRASWFLWKTPQEWNTNQGCRAVCKSTAISTLPHRSFASAPGQPVQHPECNCSLSHGIRAGNRLDH